MVWGATLALKKQLRFSVLYFQAHELPLRDLPNQSDVDHIVHSTSFHLLLLHHLCDLSYYSIYVKNMKFGFTVDCSLSSGKLEFLSN